MILIAHRGNINGKIDDLENSPNYVDDAINLNYDVEIDLWVNKGLFYTGHDSPQYKINLNWLQERMQNLWIHCKNIEALEQLSTTTDAYNYFWHETDTVTLTSSGYIWAYPGKQPIKNSIAVLPEINNDEISYCRGICSDYIFRFRTNR